MSYMFAFVFKPLAPPYLKALFLKSHGAFKRWSLNKESVSVGAGLGVHSLVLPWSSWLPRLWMQGWNQPLHTPNTKPKVCALNC